MAECIFCKNNIWYGGYADGGCEHIDNVELDEHSICKYFEFTDETRAQNVLTAKPDREKTYNWLKKHVKQ